jgi:hypothetical protein
MTIGKKLRPEGNPKWYLKEHKKTSFISLLNGRAPTQRRENSSLRGIFPGPTRNERQLYRAVKW